MLLKKFLFIFVVFMVSQQFIFSSEKTSREKLENGMFLQTSSFGIGSSKEKILESENGDLLAKVSYEFRTRFFPEYEKYCEVVRIDAFVKGKGYGTLLLKKLFEELRANGYLIVELESLSDAKDFYFKLGFNALPRKNPDALLTQFRLSL